MNPPPKVAKIPAVLPPTPVGTLARKLLGRLLAIVFLLVCAADYVVAYMDVRSPAMDALLTGSAAALVALPVLFQWVIVPASAIIAAQAEAAAARRLDAILQSVSDAVIISDIGGVIRFANRAMHRLLEFAPGTIVGRRTVDLAPSSHAEVRAADIKAFLAGEPCQLLNQGAQEGLAQRSNGEEFPVELTWSSLPAGPIGKTQFVAILREITARKRTEAALRESEQLFRTLADTAPAMIWMAGPDGYLNFLNKGWLDFRGRALEEELNLGWAEGLHPDDYARCLATFDTATRRRQPYEMEYRMRRHDGEYRWLLDRGVPRWGPEGDLAGFVGICMDVTVRKQAEEALRSSERRFRELLEGLPVAVRILQDNRVAFANLADARLHGYEKPEDEIGLPAFQQVVPEEVPRMEELHRKRMAGEAAPGRYEVRRRRADGVEVLAEVEAERTFFNGRPASLLVLRDLTDRKRVEVYEKLLPVCCVCGKIRDDNGQAKGAGGWERLDQYLQKHSDAEFSHTFCPDCYGEYRRKNLQG